MAAAVLWSVTSQPVRAIDFIRSSGNGMGQTVNIRQSSATELLTLPTGALDPRDWLLETGYSRQFELADFDQFFIAGATRYRQFTAALGLQQFGSADLYREQTVKLALAYSYDSLTVGLSWSGMQIDFGDDADFHFRASTIGAGVSYRTRLVYAGLAADNLTSPKLYENAVPLEPVYSFYAEVLGQQSFSVTGRITWERYQKPQLALGQRIALAERSSFFWGLSTEPLTFGGGIELYVAKAAITYAANYHPTLGLSHTVTVAAGRLFQRKRSSDDFK
jgi:hypothetical protein